MNWNGFKSVFMREYKRFFKVKNDTIISPMVSALLYIAIFGFIIGSRIDNIKGISYMTFLIPGLVMMNVITSSYTNAAFSLFFSRFLKMSNVLLSAPLSYLEMVLALVLASVARGIIVGTIVLIVGFFFIGFSMYNFLVFLFFMLITAIIFASLGILAGLWAEEFDNLNIFTTYLITPLTFLGGVFYSIDMLPEVLKTITKLNPFFYMINGLRYGVIGVSDSGLFISFLVVSIIALVIFFFAVFLFSKGWKLRD